MQRIPSYAELGIESAAYNIPTDYFCGVRIAVQASESSAQLGEELPGGDIFTLSGLAPPTAYSVGYEPGDARISIARPQPSRIEGVDDATPGSSSAIVGTPGAATQRASRFAMNVGGLAENRLIATLGVSMMVRFLVQHFQYGCAPDSLLHIPAGAAPTAISPELLSELQADIRWQSALFTLEGLGGALGQGLVGAAVPAVAGALIGFAGSHMTQRFPSTQIVADGVRRVYGRMNQQGLISACFVLASAYNFRKNLGTLALETWLKSAGPADSGTASVASTMPSNAHIAAFMQSADALPEALVCLAAVATTAELCQWAYHSSARLSAPRSPTHSAQATAATVPV